MEMLELAKEYRESAAMLKWRIGELKESLGKDKMCEMEKLRLRRRIDILLNMYHDTNETAMVMERYYDRRYKRNGRFSI